MDLEVQLNILKGRQDINEDRLLACYTEHSPQSPPSFPQPFFSSSDHLNIPNDDLLNPKPPDPGVCIRERNNGKSPMEDLSPLRHSDGVVILSGGEEQMDGASSLVSGIKPAYGGTVQAQRNEDPNHGCLTETNNSN